MRYRRFFLMLALLVVALVSCKKDESLKESEAVRFLLKATELGPNYAVVEIRHNGTNRDLYYGFVVEGRVRDVRAAVDSVMKSDEEVLENAFSQRKRVVQVTPLMPDETYSYVAFGLSESGEVTGVMDTCCFRTAEGMKEFTLNEGVTIDVMGEAYYNYEYWTRVDFTMADDYQGFNMSCVVAASDMESNKLGKVIYAQTAELVKYLADNDGATVADCGMVSQISTSDYFWRSPGDYYAMAIEVDEKGQPTGLYQVTEKFHIDDYTMLQQFERLLGTWSVKDADGKTTSVVVENEATNRRLRIKKYAGAKYEFVAHYLPENKCAVVYYQMIKEGVKVKGKLGDIYVNAWYSNDKNSPILNWSMSKVAILQSQGENKARMECGFTASDYKYLGLVYEVKFEDGEKAYYGDTKFRFPFSMTRSE